MVCITLTKRMKVSGNCNPVHKRRALTPRAIVVPSMQDLLSNRERTPQTFLIRPKLLNTITAELNLKNFVNMKFVKFFLVLVVASVFITSCGEDLTNSTEMVDPFDTSVRVNTDQLNFPEKIPADLMVHELLISETTTWEDLDTYYKTEVLLLSKQPYFDNLQWLVLMELSKRADFLSDAPTETQQFYLAEIFDRDYINSPKVAAEILSSLGEKDALTKSEVGRYARLVEQRNREHLSDENFAQHRVQYADDFTRLTTLGYDRWGAEK